MKNFLIAFSVFLVWAIFGLWLYSWLNVENKGTDLNSDNSAETVIKDSSNSLSHKIPAKIYDANINEKDSIIKNIANFSQNGGLTVSLSSGELLFKYDEGILALFNSDKIIIPSANQNFEGETKKYLTDHPSKEVQIISVYSPKENSVSPNYGIQRGNTLKKSLIDAGIPSKKISIKSIIKETNIDAAGYFKNSVSLNFKPMDLDNIIEDSISIPDKKILYPDYASSGVLKNKKLKNLADNLKIELAENPTWKIEVVGHTDNVGSGIDNYGAGLNYANQIKYYLQNSQGIDATRIKAKSKGENEPLVVNNSEKNRNINRRIEINYTY